MRHLFLSLSLYLLTFHALLLCLVVLCDIVILFSLLSLLSHSLFLHTLFSLFLFHCCTLSPALLFHLIFLRCTSPLLALVGSLPTDDDLVTCSGVSEYYSPVMSHSLTCCTHLLSLLLLPRICCLPSSASPLIHGDVSPFILPHTHSIHLCYYNLPVWC